MDKAKDFEEFKSLFLESDITETEEQHAEAKIEKHFLSVPLALPEEPYSAWDNGLIILELEKEKFIKRPKMPMSLISRSPDPEQYPKNT